MHIPPPEHAMTNLEIERAMVDLPDMVATALKDWRMAQLARERRGGMLFMSLKAAQAGQARPPSREVLQAQVEADDEHYKLRLVEITKEAEYTALYEKLMAAKRMAGLREAF